MLRDPRSQRRYRTARALWLAGFNGAPALCILCHHLIDTTLPGTHRLGPTIEHRTPIRWIRANASSDEEALAWACDTTQWGAAHKVCQDRQGGASSVERIGNVRGNAYIPSREW